MRLRHATPVTLPDRRYGDILKLWTLRALLHCGSPKDTLANFTCGLESLMGLNEESLGDLKAAQVRGHLQRMLDRLERQAVALPTDTVIARNVEALGECLGMNAVERDILHFTVLQRLVAEFDAALDCCGRLTRAALNRLVAISLGHPIEQVRAALDDNGLLTRSSLLWVDSSSAYSFSGKVEMLDGLSDELTVEHDDLISMVSRSVVRADAPGLTLDDYPHLGDDIGILRAYLQRASARGERGVNVLLHGRPGTGKTELVRALAKSIGGELLEIPVEEPGGKPRTGLKRFESFRFAQSLLAKSRGHFLLFDEVEDVFNEDLGPATGDGNASGIKGWVNRWLETNAVPTFWVTNHLGSIDPAYRRRFDYVLEVGVPPTSVRRRIVDRWTHGLAVDDRWRERAARHPDMVPAIVGRAARVGAMVAANDSGVEVEQVMTRVVNRTLDALGRRPLEAAHKAHPIDYRIDLLNPDADLTALREGLRQVGSGRLLLSGPPGTGKTAFGRHVAEALERPLLIRRTSDILGPYVGQTERQIAEMFEQARDDGAIVMLDEVDSLLQDRQGATRTWEVTQVNEMLTQMEDFEGIFIASTNLVDTLDAAALRRFDAHVRLGYLRADQAGRMFGELATALALSADEEVLHGLSRLDRLTPGDFAAVWRMCRLTRPATAAEVLARLRRVCADKKDGKAREIGFAARASAGH